MISFPNCKINLGLHILEKRTDGFHDLETLFYPVALTDALEIIQAPDAHVAFSMSGISLDGDAKDNICMKAYELLKKDFPQLPAIHMHLHKNIPAGAGLGGGSADGAFTLLLLNRKFGLQLTGESLIHYALMLGSDCPFFILNKPCVGRGRGEKLERFELDLSPYRMMLVNPGIHVNTGWAFSRITPKRDRTPLKEIIQQPVDRWKGSLTNDFEPIVFAAHPEVGMIRETMYSNGAIYASMSGSGSSVFGLFPKTAASELSFPSHYYVRWFQ